MRHKLQNTRFFPRLVGTGVCAYAILGLLMIVSAPLSRELRVFRHFMDNVFLPLPGSSIAWTVAMFLLGGALLAGKRMGWGIAVVVLVTINVVNVILLVLPESFELDTRTAVLVRAGAVVQAIALVLFLFTRPAFNARTRPGSFRQAIAVWALGSIVVFAIGCALTTSYPGTLIGADRYKWVLNHAVTLSLVDPSQYNGHGVRWVAFVISALSACVIIAAAWTLLRSQARADVISETDEGIIRTMIARFNKDDSLAYFATRRDKSVVYSPDGRAAVTYAVFSGVSLASGDPIGDPESWDAAVQEWLSRSRRYGWTPACMGASERGARILKKNGMSVLRLGDEAVLHSDRFRLSDPELRGVRQSVNHVRREGMTFRVRRHSELTAEEMQQVEERADRWRDTADERGFSMALSRLGDPRDGDCLLVEALIDGDVVAELSFVPWGPSGVSLDLMRRSPSSPNGTIEAMVAELCTNESLGISRISLNFAVFRQIFATESKIDAGPVTTLTRKILVFFSRWWQMEALYRSNVKYNPEWYPRYLCYAESSSLLRTSIGSGMAEGFLPAFFRGDPAGKYGREADTPGSRAALQQVPEWQDDIAHGTQRRRPVSEQVAVRRDRAEKFLSEGIDPWPEAVAPTGTCASVPQLPSGEETSIAGRVVARRRFGGVTFLEVQDHSGRCQVVLESSNMGDGGVWKNIDLADLIRVSGRAGASRTGHPSLIADSLELEAKSLHPLPTKLENPEVRLRDRHLDMTVNPQVNKALRVRSAVLLACRSVLRNRGYMEVETPILQSVHGGANARPFTTHINAYDMDLYLRIAPELYLKRLMCGGADRIFEIGRNFRNEGASNKHNPEFTVLEAYEAHGNYRTMMDLAIQVITEAATDVHGRPAITDPATGELISLDGAWQVKSVYTAVSEAAGETVTPDTPREELQRIAREHEVHVNPTWDAGKTLEELYGELVEEKTVLPTFYIDFPASVSPLTRPRVDDPRVCQRWDLVAFGMELGTAYSELTNPLEQRARLEEQSLLAAGGDAEAMEVDEDFLRALEFGMPPTGGIGLGLDRIIMLIGGGSIRDNLAFPIVR